MNGFWKRLLCLVLVCCLVSAVPISRAEGQGLPEDLYLTQIGNGTCTLCSAAMMVRSMMYINGNEAWSTVTQEALRMSAWLNGVGLKWNFKYTAESCVVHVAHQGVNGVSVDGLKAILDEHPEGIVLYCAKVPHAVYLSDYEGDVFYCAETVKGYSGKRIPLAESWMGEKYGSQEKLLENITAYWYVTAYEAKSEEPCTCRKELAGTYKVTTETADLTIRAGHGTVYSVMGYIPAGSEILVTQVSGTGEEDWAHVTYNGISGYCSMKYLELVAPLHQYETEIHEPTCTEGGYTLHRCTHCDHTYSEAPTEALGHSFGDWIKDPAQGLELRNCIRCDASESRPLTYLGTVNGDYLRVRADAGTGYEVLGFLMTGDRVEILEQKKVDDVTWGRMETGWICMDYVDLDEITTEPPATEPPAMEPPATEPPATEPPATEPPATEPPATEPPATEPPATEPPATEPPATEPPATEPPVTEPEEKKQMGTVNGDYLRIRSGAGTGYEVLGFLMTGDRVEILEQKTVGAMSWGRTADGWISMTYVVMDQPEPPAVTPPVTEPPATEPPTTEPPATESPATEPEEKTVMGTVTGNYLRVRSGAGTGYEVVGFVMTGDRVEILEQKTVDGMTWGRIASGWISLDYVELDKPAEALPEQTRMVIVDTDCLRVRSGAGLGHEIVGFLYRNAKVEILEETTVDGMTWGRTESGWISMDYVR